MCPLMSWSGTTGATSYISKCKFERGTVGNPYKRAGTWFMPARKVLTLYTRMTTIVVMNIGTVNYE